MTHTLDQLLRFVEENDIKFIRLAFCDMFGVQKNIAIMSSQLRHAAEQGVSFDASAIPGFANVAESDLFLQPDLGTFALLPWRPSEGCVGRLFCNVRYPDGRPFEGDGRALLRSTEQAAAKEGYHFLVGPECEFYLFETDEHGRPTRTPFDQGGYAAVADYDNSVLQGIVKIASKMGISTLQSYQGSQIFEAVGISQEVIDAYFTGTVSRIGGITLEDVAAQTDAQHSRAFDPLGLAFGLSLPSMGRHKYRSQGETHRYSPQVIHLLQQATRTGSYALFCQYTQAADAEHSGLVRSLLEFNWPARGVPLEEVESEGSILRRFKTGAMSYGSISQEAHETLALAMNRLGGRSNSGEGGESDERLASAGTSEDRSSAIKQVASGRFGVTSRYLVSAKEIRSGRKARRERSSASRQSLSLGSKDPPLHPRREPRQSPAPP